MKREVIRKLINSLSILIFALGTVRIFALVLHDPILGYGNNFDMIRVQSCLQIWPADPGIQPGYALEASPLREYELGKGEIFKRFCIPGSELIFGYIGKLAAQALTSSTFSIKLMGLVRSLALLVAAFSFLLAFLRSAEPTAAFIHSLVYLIVIADPANTLYFNTFYKEFSALLFAYLSFLWVWWICVHEESPASSVSLAGCILLLGFSSHQHVLLPCVIIAGLCIAKRHRLASIKKTLLFSLFSIIIIYSYHNVYRAVFAEPGTYSYAINYANATDTFLGAVLPSAEDPHEAARILGLPAHCVEHSGKTWYTPGVQESHPCPEVLDVSRLRIGLLVLEQPEFLFESTSRGISLLRPWTLKYLGSVGGREFGYAGQFMFTISDWLDRIPEGFMKILFLFPGALGIFALTSSFKQKGSTKAQCLKGFLVSAVLSLYTVFYSSLFGDGYIEFQRHAHLYFSLYLSMLIVLATVGLRNLSAQIYSRLNASVTP